MDGTFRSYALPESDDDGLFEADLPDFASVLSVQVGGQRSKLYPLKQGQGSTSVFKVDIDSKFLAGFFRALGAHVDPYSMEVEAASP